MFHKVSAVFAAVALSSQAFAQSMPNPGGMAPDTPRMETGTPPKDHANTQDKLFVRQAALGNRAEIELGKLAASKATTPAVRDYAKRMQADHGKSGDKLMRIGKKAEPNIPGELDPEHKRIRDNLNKASGRDFDIAYLTSQVTDHQRTANLLLWHMSFGQSAELTQYSQETLPVVMEHLQHAKQQLMALTSAPVPDR